MGTIATSSTLEEFFADRVQDCIAQHGVQSGDSTRWYLVQLLCTAAAGHRLFERDDVGSRPPPLAELYRRACEAPDPAERGAQMQRLGDLALLVSSLFAGSLRRKPVKVDYVIAMGGAAYDTLASGGCGRRAAALGEVFDDLATHFADYAIALAEVGAPDAGTLDTSLEALQQDIERWEETRHPAIARRLRARGVFVDSDTTAAAGLEFAAPGHRTH